MPLYIHTSNLLGELNIQAALVQILRGLGNPPVYVYAASVLVLAVHDSALETSRPVLPFVADVLARSH